MAPSSTCDAVAGVWTRLFEEDPIGDEESADKTTLVLWTQTPKSGIYVDIRLPLDSPGRSDTFCSRKPRPSALRATTTTHFLDGYDVSLLARQKSFAGILTYSVGDTSDPPGVALAKDRVLAEASKKEDVALPLCTCFWKRDIDYQPPSGGLDIGVCASYSPQTDDGVVDLRETGDDGSYAEGWHRMVGTHRGPFMALELLSENAHKRTGFWVRTGNRFAYAVGRPSDPETALALGCLKQSSVIKEKVGKTLEEAVQSMKSGGEIAEQECTAMIGSYVAVAGTIDSSSGWRIIDSTNPGLVGCCLVGDDMKTEANCCSTLQTESKDVKEGDTVDQVVAGEGSYVRRWKVVELSGCSLPFPKS